MHLLGIELSETHIKCVEVTKYKQKIILNKGHILENPKSYRSSLDLVKAIKELLKANHYSAKKLIILINSRQTLIRQFTIPYESEVTIKQQLEIKPEIYLPITRGTHQIDFKILANPEIEAHKRLVQFVAMPNKLIDNAIELSKKLKRHLIQITIPSDGIATLLSKSKQTILIIDIGKEQTKLIVIETNGGQFVRHIAFGMQNMEALVKAYFSETNESPTGEAIFKLVRPQIDYYIILEVKRILQFYRTRYDTFTIETIYLLGETRFKEYISAALDIETKTIDISQEITSQIEDSFTFSYLLGAMKAL